MCHALKELPVADTGFPYGGVDLVGGGVDSRGGYVLKILYDKTKESGPLGGGRVPGTPPRSANDCHGPTSGCQFFCRPWHIFR